MPPFVVSILTIIGSVLASSGFWAWMLARRDRKDKERDKNDAKTMMILGLGHDRIIYLCEKYIDRGWITSDEFENLEKYLYKPYENMGGNGTAKRLMAIVRNLPVHKNSYVVGANNLTQTATSTAEN